MERAPAKRQAAAKENDAPPLNAQARLALLARHARQAPLLYGRFSALPGAIAGGCIGAPLGVAIGSLGGSLAIGLAILVCGAGIALGGLATHYFYAKAFKRHFNSRCEHYTAVLQHSALPLLMADEAYLAEVLALVRQSGQLLFVAPPRAHSMEEQVLACACYISALQSIPLVAETGARNKVRQGCSAYRWSSAQGQWLTALLSSATGFCWIFGFAGFFAYAYIGRHWLRCLETQAIVYSSCRFFLDEPPELFPLPVRKAQS